MRSREGPAGLTPPGGVSGKSLKGARSPRPAHSSWSRRELASLSRPAPREVSAVRRAGIGARWGGPGPRAREASAGARVAGRRPSCLKASEGSWSGERLVGDGGAAAGRGRLGAAVPGDDSGELPARGARSSLGPATRSLGALRPRPGRAQPAGAATPAPRLAARPGPRQPARPAVAPGHAGRSRSAAGQALPGPAAPAPRATPPGLSALRPSPSPAPVARYFHTSRCPGPGA